METIIQLLHLCTHARNVLLVRRRISQSLQVLLNRFYSPYVIGNLGNYKATGPWTMTPSTYPLRALLQFFHAGLERSRCLLIFIQQVIRSIRRSQRKSEEESHNTERNSALVQSAFKDIVNRYALRTPHGTLLLVSSVEVRCPRWG